MTKNRRSHEIKALDLLILLLTVIVDNVSSFDCSKGCDLNPEVNGKLVCGENQVTYMNYCLAFCQGVPVPTDRSDNLCDSNNITTITDVTKYDWTAFIPIDAIVKYKDQGFQLIGKLDQSSESKAYLRLEHYMNYDTIPRTIMQNKERNYQARRLTHDGYEYVTTKSNTLRSVDRNVAFEAYIPPNPIDSHRIRNLDIIGSDTRERVNPTTTFPYSTVVAINYNRGRNVAHCSGVVIATDAVLTAGHCVYDARWGWEGHSDITPALNRYLAGMVPRVFDEPYGRWNVSEITTYRQYQITGDSDYDIAVVRYFPNEKNQTVGSVVGYVGIAGVDGVDSDENLQESTITGYPADYDYEMWTTGYCTSGFYRRISSPYKVSYSCVSVWILQLPDFFCTSLIGSVHIAYYDYLGYSHRDEWGRYCWSR
jgi:V8-like Glu-specific endopeptidase